ncbi:flagellar hook-basal body complex protein FliE [Ramlibacter sp. MAHUQ-53]|uniref:flagellar hook-basal body complex protein FliE n=1 Tax=unclassified Ramlibacter TaxID=2617605 RepID=UPI00363CAA68
MDIKTASSALPTHLLDALRRNAEAQRVAGGAGLGAPAGPAAAGERVSFSGALDQALKSVSAAQQEATRLGEAFLADPSQVSLEQSMVAMQKAQIGFQSALHVRNRLVSAYSDIMNMQV